MTRLRVRLSLAVVLLACVGARATQAQEIRVPTVQVAVADAAARLELDAVLEPVHQATVTAQVGGNVLAVRVQAGDRVRRGQPLVRLDDREVRANSERSDAAVAQAQAELRNAQQQYARSRELQRSGFVSAAALDSAQNQVRAAQAAVDQARAGQAQARVSQGFAELAAPFDAVVLATHVQGGDLALPGRALLTLYQPGLLRAVAQVPASRVALLSAAREVSVQMPDGQSLIPTARDMQPTADPVSQTVQWRLPLPAAAANLRPGQVARVHASVVAPGSKVAPNPALPATAILRRGELTAVYVATQQGFRLRAVRVGPGDGVLVEVLAGLRVGERVALDPVRAGLSGAQPQ